MERTEHDALLLRRYARERNAAAFAEVVGRYSGLVFGVARRVTGDAATAEDVAQDCFLALARKAGTIEGSLPGWLHRVAFRRALDVKRDAATRRRHEARAAEAAIRAGTEGAEGAGDQGPAWREIEPLVDTALAALPEELRLPLVEHYLCGRSQAEIAAGLGINQSTVSRRIEKGIEAVRRKLSRGGAAVPAALLVALLLSGAARAAPPALAASLGKMAVAGVGPPPGATAYGPPAGGAPALPALGPVPGAAARKASVMYLKALLLLLLAAVVAGAFFLANRGGPPAGGDETPPREPVRE